MMLVMEQIYARLNDEELVENAEDFSENWCARSKSWYGVQKGSSSDLTAQVAISCLRRVAIKLALAHLRRRTYGSIVDAEIEALGAVKAILEAYLEEAYGIVGVTGAASSSEKC